MVPFRRFRALVPIVTGFTVAHSVTLIASAYDMAPNTLWFPPLVETLIAVSIVYMAFENIVAAGSGDATRIRRRWVVAFGFGLVHGFGFSFALRETLQFAGSHLLTSLAVVQRRRPSWASCWSSRCACRPSSCSSGSASTSAPARS